jgi:hypothetical protein
MMVSFKKATVRIYQVKDLHHNNKIANQMKNLESFENFSATNEAKKVDAKKGYTISTKVQDSIKKLCENMIHNEAMDYDKNENKEQTYEKYVEECGSYMKESMKECMESYKSSMK